MTDTESQGSMTSSNDDSDKDKVIIVKKKCGRPPMDPEERRRRHGLCVIAWRTQNMERYLEYKHNYEITHTVESRDRKRLYRAKIKQQKLDALAV